MIEPCSPLNFPLVNECYKEIPPLQRDAVLASPPTEGKQWLLYRILLSVTGDGAFAKAIALQHRWESVRAAQ